MIATAVLAAVAFDSVAPQRGRPASSDDVLLSPSRQETRAEAEKIDAGRAAPPRRERTVPGTCQTYAVLASEDGDGTIPKNLEFMREWLTDEPCDRYGSFQLIDAQAVGLELGGRASIVFETGHRMRLELRGVDKDILEFHLEIVRARAAGDRRLVSVDYSIENGQMLLLHAGGHTLGETSGRIFLAARCTHDTG